jgi:hypothetical protein
MKTPDFSRRDFVKGLSAATLGALGAGLPRPSMAAEGEALRPPATADTIIVLWMGGGMASTETFDPKRYTPYEKGMNPNTVLSTFPSIPTAVDGIRLSEGLEKVAKVVGVMAPVAVVNICMLVALLVSVNASAATTDTNPVDTFPNCSVPLLNPRPVN